MARCCLYVIVAGIIESCVSNCLSLKHVVQLYLYARMWFHTSCPTGCSSCIVLLKPIQSISHADECQFWVRHVATATEAAGHTRCCRQVHTCNIEKQTNSRKTRQGKGCKKYHKMTDYLYKIQHCKSR